MRIFVSYASERRSIGERLSLALRSEGHDVFLDTTSLPPGQAYDEKIRNAIARCDLFVFLVSPESIESTSYCRTELDMMARRAPVAGDRVLGVIVAPVDLELVPNYLRALNLLHPVGDLTADVLARISDIAGARRNALLKWLLVAGSVALVLAGAIAAVVYRQRSDRSRGPEARTPDAVALEQSLSVFQASDQNSEIVDQVKAGEEVTLLRSTANPNWVQIKTPRGQGWAMAQDVVFQRPEPGTIKLGQGYGFQGSFWRLFFTSPQPGGKPPNKLGIDARFADAIGRTQKSLDIAIYELNSRLITDAILEVHRRGHAVRVVTDGRSAETPGMTFRELTAAGIRVVARPDRGGIMHNKFAIVDRETVWTGSWNYTDSATYANNENAIELQGRDIATRYQGLFDQMFSGSFGRRRQPGADAPVGLGHEVTILFAPEDAILPELVKRVSGAKRSILFLTFSFTVDELAHALQAAAARGVVARGIFEKSLTRNAVISSTSVVRSLCQPDSHVQLRLDSNPRYLHHDVIVVDGNIVITGSLNFSRAALMRNDENVVIVPDPVLAKKFDAEFSRLWATAAPPEPAACADRP